VSNHWAWQVERARALAGAAGVPGYEVPLLKGLRGGGPAARGGVRPSGHGGRGWQGCGPSRLRSGPRLTRWCWRGCWVGRFRSFRWWGVVGGSARREPGGGGYRAQRGAAGPAIRGAVTDRGGLSGRSLGCRVDRSGVWWIVRVCGGSVAADCVPSAPLMRSDLAGISPVCMVVAM
jgi:hypothetical protein